ncbi:hypothetical protein K435DRAFT_857650 [Dendrothele bispora CBS 962.96]|uniref:Uncharacterized protein n=1 Tax=Dendrothele bispora (strain CBS 962.96) TaxID=1314807 RepID=A0A4S8M5T1_DENBC|nr:hypothetical protein K435DRAFT_857650 [Dendrothele bispora CBS 962.96]
MIEEAEKTIATADGMSTGDTGAGMDSDTGADTGSGNVMGDNYAYGGAMIDVNLAPPFTPTVLSMTDQINEFLITISRGAGSRPEIALRMCSWFSLFFYPKFNDFSHNYSDTLLDTEFALIQKLYDIGARNFLFLNVPPFQRSPYVFKSLEGSNMTAPILQAVTEDTKLVQRVQDLKAINTDVILPVQTHFKRLNLIPGQVTTFLWDSYEDFTKILDNPTQYGFRDTTMSGSDDDLSWE